MFRAVPTKRFYLYTAKWNRDRLVDALLDFNEVELTEIKDPELKPIKEDGELDDRYMDALKELELKIEEIEGIVGSIDLENIEETAHITLEDVEKLSREADEKIELLMHLSNPKLIEKIKEELEKVNNELAWLEEEIVSSLEPKVKASLGVEENQVKIFEVLNSLEEKLGYLERTLNEIMKPIQDAKSMASLSNKLKDLLSQIERDLSSLPKDIDIDGKISSLYKDLRARVEDLTSLINQFASQEEETSRFPITQIMKSCRDIQMTLDELRALIADVADSVLSMSVFLSEGFSLEKILPEYAEKAKPLIERKNELEKRISPLEDLLERKDAEIERIRQDLAELGRKMASAALGIKRSLLISKILEYLYEGEKVIVVSGWIPSTFEEEFREHMNSSLGSIMELRIEEDEKGPSYIRLPKIAAPFRLLTHKMVGYPKAKQLDPTPLVSLLFPIMFGIMFGDVGHGLAALLFGLLLRRKKGGLRDLGGILVPMGICSVFFGLLYGEVFLKEAYHPILFSPIHEPTKILLVAVLFGLIHLNIAFAANTVNKIGEGKYLDAMFHYGGLFTIGMYGLAAFAVYRVGGDVISAFGDPFMMGAAGLFGISMLTMMIEPKLKGHGLSEGMMEVFEAALEGTIGLLANTLSYLRLAGFAIAHASFGIIIKSIVGEGGSLASFIIASASMNILSMGLEGMIAFIQATRLTLYEFMTKFFKGEGRALRTIDGLLG
ncbi:MAG TPA: hypothetical protein EYP68_08725 [Candidatus Korarchaeota archaeon]|nr:hypothetical protein [Candidatus Korarchaeota archaeon]